MASEAAIQYHGAQTAQGGDSGAKTAGPHGTQGRAQLLRGGENPEENGKQDQHDRRMTGM